MQVKKRIVNLVFGAACTQALVFCGLMVPKVAAQRGSGSTPASRSCSGLGNAISKRDIVNRASAENRRTINFTGGSFERSTLTSLNVPRNINPQRAFPSNIRAAEYGPSSVIPDGIVDLFVVRRIGIFPFTFGLNVRYRDSGFFDPKAISGRFALSDEDGQAVGYIDYLSTRSEAGIAAIALLLRNREDRPTPTLFYVTPSDGVIGSSIIDEALFSGVAVVQHVVCDTIPQGGQLGVDDLVVGKGIYLNPEVFRNRAIPPNIDIGVPAGSRFTLSDPPRPPGSGGSGGSSSGGSGSSGSGSGGSGSGGSGSSGSGGSGSGGSGGSGSVSSAGVMPGPLAEAREAGALYRIRAEYQSYSYVNNFQTPVNNTLDRTLRGPISVQVFTSSLPNGASIGSLASFKQVCFTGRRWSGEGPDWLCYIAEHNGGTNGSGYMENPRYNVYGNVSVNRVY